ncbi:MAG TPA: uracil-DNA glycosylase [Verrucomicrobiota bacterium]|mgnify:CR=1 FL=1|nr:uracil-DNA glycosylase [Verrucomicrobiota bacterium]
MADAFTVLLDATVAHLEVLRADGVRFVPVSAAVLAELKLPSARGAASPVPPRAPVRPAAPSPVPPAPPVSRAPAAPALPSPLAPPARAAAMEEIRQRALGCLKCPHLARTRKSVVFGVGDVNAALMFVGEAPGADEDAQGEPFVGKAGQLLTKIIQTMGLSREGVYIANILKCRPDTPGQAWGNRPPTADEMDTCKPYLMAQIDIIQPRVIVALGATAVQGLLDTKSSMSALRGRWQGFRGIPVMPTFHPAYLLRNQSLTEKRKVWEDMLLVLEKLGLPITEKMRGYFLKAG